SVGARPLARGDVGGRVARAVDRHGAEGRVLADRQVAGLDGPVDVGRADGEDARARRGTGDGAEHGGRATDVDRVRGGDVALRGRHEGERGEVDDAIRPDLLQDAGDAVV